MNDELQCENEAIFAYDTEVYPNYFLAVFKKITPTCDGEYKTFTHDQLGELRTFLKQDNISLVGYNNFGFDDPIIKCALAKHGIQPDEKHHFAQLNFSDNDDDKKQFEKARHTPTKWQCIDLMQILGGPRIAGSLKSHEIRLDMLNVQDLPIPPNTVLTDEQKATILEYCKHDVDATEKLYWDTKTKIDVRHHVNIKYPYMNGSALRRSDPSIAEKVIKQELQTNYGLHPETVRNASKYVFNPAAHICPNIAFSDTNSQTMLERLRALPEHDVVDWNKYCSQFSFTVGPHKIILGTGGLHTQIPAQCVKSESISEYDVTSYYPSILKMLDTNPSKLISGWTTIFNKLTEDRLAAKTSGDKASADVYKIIINSIYGKLKSEYSINYDPALQLRVVVNGQLFLLMLMEQFHDAGFNVISANTDGIYVNTGSRLIDANVVANNWMNTTGFMLEHKKATMFVATSVNDYALFEPSNNWFHKKGRFATDKRTKPRIITEAVLNHLSHNTPIEEYIRNPKNSLFDFVYSQSVKGKDIDIRHNGQPCQKTNRWYKSKQGHPIEKRPSNELPDVNWARVSNSDSCQIVNHFKNPNLPSDLDFDHYINEANTMLNDITNHKQPPKTPKSKLIEAAKKAITKGLMAVPKGRVGAEKANISKVYEKETIEYWKTTPLENADWSNHIGVGAYTGKEFGVIGIDIDNPELARNTTLFDHLKTGGLVIWHGEGTDADVRNGTKRGTVLFTYDGDDLRTTNHSFYTEFGFEILYGKKVIHLYGKHPSGESYRYKGKLKKLPANLLSMLQWKIKDDYDDQGEVTPDEQDLTPASHYLLEHFQQIANTDDEYNHLGGSLEITTDTKQGYHLKGLCIGHESHTNKTGTQQMTVKMWGGKPKVDCFHQSCADTRRKWQHKINGQTQVIKKLSVNPQKVLVWENQEELFEAISDPAKHKLIVAPTGSGKTHNIVSYVAKLLDKDSVNNDKFAIICSTKDQMKQIAERFADVLETDNINEYGIDLIEASASIKVGTAQSRESVTKTTQVAITHYTYCSRKKFSIEYYAFLKFIDENTHVIIDEIDAFIDSQTKNYQLGGRFKRLSSGGKFKYQKMNKCGMFHGSGNCANCLMRKYDAHQFGFDKYNNMEYKPNAEFMEETKHKPLDHIDIQSRLIKSVQVGNAEVSILKQTPDSGFMIFKNENAAEFKVTFDDIHDSAYLPTIHRPIITVDGQEITRQDMIDRYSKNGEFNVPDDDRKRLRFPSGVCNVLTSTTIDRRSIIHIANAKSLMGLTATISDHQTRFLHEIMPTLKPITILPKDDQKMDKIIVVGMSRHIPLKMYKDTMWRFNKLFRFRETKAAAISDFEALKKSVRIQLGFDKSDFGRYSDEDPSLGYDILQTYSFGSLGRGMDFGDYDVADINAGIYKPVSAFVSDDPKDIKKQVQSDRASITIQNIGRILRRSKKSDKAEKVIVLEEMESESDLNDIAAKLNKMSHTTVESWWVPHFIDTEELGEWLTKICDAKSIPNDVPHTYKDLIDRASKLVDQGIKLKAIKKELRWATVRKQLTQSEENEVETTISELLIKYRDSTTNQRQYTDARRDSLRVKRLNKINLLHGSGNSVAQIRSRMKVYDKVQQWPKTEQEWFESTIQEFSSITQS